MAMVKVRLYGKLRQFGRDFSFNVSSKREVIDALSCQINGFKQFLVNAEKKGMAFTVFEDNKNLSEDDLKLTAKEGRLIRIAPVIIGSKRGGFLQVVLGVALVGAAIFSGGLATAAAGTALGFGATAAAGIGLSLVAGGLSQALSPTPKEKKGYDQDGNAASYMFGGAVTTTAQGNPVALIYGEREVGGAIISAGVYAENKA